MKSMLLILSLLPAVAPCAARAEAPLAEPVSRGYQLTFSDEFDGTTLDRTK